MGKLVKRMLLLRWQQYVEQAKESADHGHKSISVPPEIILQMQEHLELLNRTQEITVFGCCSHPSHMEEEKPTKYTTTCDHCGMPIVGGQANDMFGTFHPECHEPSQRDRF